MISRYYSDRFLEIFDCVILLLVSTGFKIIKHRTFVDCEFCVSYFSLHMDRNDLEHVVAESMQIYGLL